MEKDVTRIIGLEAENVKRIKAVELNFLDGLTVIGGKNRQGKTSILDTIMALVGGNSYTPSNAVRDGEKKGKAKITLNNGVSIETTFTKNGRTGLKVSGSGMVGGPQTLINKIFGEKALDITRFLKASEKEKAEILKGIIPVDIEKYDAEYQELYEARREKNRDIKRLQAQIDSMVIHEGIPKKPISVDELIRKWEDVKKHNEMQTELEKKHAEATNKKNDIERKISELECELKQRKSELFSIIEDIEDYEDMLEGSSPMPVEDVKAQIQRAAETNDLIKHNQEREKKAVILESEIADATKIQQKMVDNREQLKADLEAADLPFPGLNVEDGQLTFHGKAWDCMSTAEQIVVAAAIQSKLTPEAPIILIDHLESLDKEAMGSLKKWADSNKIQIIGTIVTDTGDDCNYMIEDGSVV